MTSDDWPAPDIQGSCWRGIPHGETLTASSHWPSVWPVVRKLSRALIGHSTGENYWAWVTWGENQRSNSVELEQVNKPQNYRFSLKQLIWVKSSNIMTYCLGYVLLVTGDLHHTLSLKTQPGFHSCFVRNFQDKLERQNPPSWLPRLPDLISQATQASLLDLILMKIADWEYLF